MPTTPVKKPRRDRTAEILDVAYGLCHELPFPEITIEAIAARAKVGKPTIYRRWPSKGPLLLDAYLAHLPAVPLPDSGDFSADLRQWLYGIADVLDGPAKKVLTGLVGAAQTDPDLALAWRNQIFEPIRSANVTLLRSAQDAGHLRPGDPELFADLLAGPLWFRLLLTGEVPERDRIDAMIELVTGIKPA